LQGVWRDKTGSIVMEMEQTANRRKRQEMTRTGRCDRREFQRNLLAALIGRHRVPIAQGNRNA